MKCSVCDGSAFSLDEGLQICNDCGTIVEKYIELESQEVFVDLDCSRLVRVKKQKVEKEQSTKKSEPKWTKHEVFNLILFEWTKALRNLGASARFEQIVFELWVLYLQRTNVAFVPNKTEEDFEQSKTSVLLNKRYSYSFYTVQEEDIGAVKVLKMPCFRGRKPDLLTFDKLLGLLYLAALLAEETILLMDILRWCREGCIPYLSAQNLLSQECDVLVHWAKRLPSSYELRQHTESLVLYLNIEYLPVPSLENVTDRMVKLLRLPDLVGILALEHMKKISACEGGIPVIGIEHFAMAAVVVVIKAYYGVNDCDEIHLSCAYRRINKEIGKNSKITPLFCYEDWERYINKLIWFCGEIDPITRLHCQSFETFIRGNVDLYKKFLWSEGIWRTGTRLEKIDPQTYSIIENINDLQKENISELLNQPVITKATKEPLHSVVEEFIKAHDNEPQYHHQVKFGKELLEESFAGTYFSQPSLETLQKELKNYGSGIKIHSSIATEQVENASDKDYVYVPQPLETVSTTTLSAKERFCHKLDSSYGSLKWLIQICSLFCEAGEADILELVAVFENLYPL